MPIPRTEIIDGIIVNKFDQLVLQRIGQTDELIFNNTIINDDQEGIDFSLIPPKGEPLTKNTIINNGQQKGIDFSLIPPKAVEVDTQPHRDPGDVRQRVVGPVGQALWVTEATLTILDWEPEATALTTQMIQRDPPILWRITPETETQMMTKDPENSSWEIQQMSP